MSALTQSRNLYRPQRRLSEQEALQQIARFSLMATDAEAGIESLAALSLRIPGISGIRIVPAPSLSDRESLEYSASLTAAPCGTALAALAANGENWGRLQVFFEPRIPSLESPLQFARFLGQQIALMLNRIYLSRQAEFHSARIAHLQRRVETRKAVHRATGILAATRRISQAQALRAVLKHARAGRRSLNEVAQAIILGDIADPSRRPSLRRVAPTHPTSTYERYSA